MRGELTERVINPRKVYIARNKSLQGKKDLADKKNTDSQALECSVEVGNNTFSTSFLLFSPSTINQSYLNIRFYSLSLIFHLQLTPKPAAL